MRVWLLRLALQATKAWRVQARSSLAVSIESFTTELIEVTIEAERGRRHANLPKQILARVRQEMRESAVHDDDSILGEVR